MKSQIRLTIFLVFAYACNEGDTCSNDIIKELKKGDKKAVIFFRDCGATTATSIQVSILDKSKQLDKNMTGNTLILDKGYDSAIAVDWISKDTLKISFDKKLQSFTKESEVAGVKIIYVEK